MPPSTPSPARSPARSAAASTSTPSPTGATTATATRETSAAVDRYLNAFEKGALDDEDHDIQARLTNLRKQSKQLRADKTRLESDLDQPPTGPTPEDLALIGSQITEIITTGGHKAKKALVEALIEDIEIPADDSVIPRFRIPTANNGEGLTLKPALDQLPVNSAVRALPHRVGRTGLEPATEGMRPWPLRRPQRNTRPA